MAPGVYSMCLSLEATVSSINKNICVTASITNKDPCESLPCQNYGQCVSAMGNFTCLCLPTYTGTVCEKVLDLCSPSPCVHGKCFKVFSGVPSFYCLCQPGWKGRTCDSERDNNNIEPDVKYDYTIIPKFNHDYNHEPNYKCDCTLDPDCNYNHHFDPDFKHGCAL
ncbi:fibropellin-1-like [Haliotis rubra]|uniref:fibropellin-1-like n=1 Tax=Haliotis rubra TaxID=36100 RepID=UPI001EE5A0AC|nr:fibropellin-1-like [Haliotis rubra]